MSLHPPHEKEQLRAIEIQLDKAPKIQEDLKEELGYEKNIFFNLDLFEYRINNSCKDIAEDLDVKSRHGFKKNKTARGSVSYAFRGYDGAHFLEHEFGGLFSEEMNDIIEEIRYEKNGLETADMINPETGVGYLVEARRKSIEARGAFSWRDNLEYVLEIGELKYEKGLTWKETTTVMNEKYDKDWATATVRMAYQSNKDLLPDEEE